MLLIRCPYCDEDRPELEFSNAGEAHLTRPDGSKEISDDELTDMLFMRTNPRGVYIERWRHTHGCGKFFNAVRQTYTDKFLKVYKSGVRRPTDAELRRLSK